MGNTCSTCEDEVYLRELSFKELSRENRLEARLGDKNRKKNQDSNGNPNYANRYETAAKRMEASVHEYSSKPNLNDRNYREEPSFGGNTDPKDHQPPSHIATPVTSMNPVSAPASQAISRLPPFKPSNPSQNPEFGPMKYKQNGETYKGQYYQGLKNGYGEQTTVQGSGYIGEWKNDLKHGKGRMAFANGDLYEGGFNGGVVEGKGKFYNQQTGSVYEGDFKNNRQNGKGKEIFKDGAYYEGDFVNDTKTGNGLFVFADGSRYTGMFKDDEIEGRGKLKN